MNKREVIDKAEEFCKKHNINQYPVRIASLCSHYDLSVREEYLPENVSGFIVVQKEKFNRFNTGRLIVVNLLESSGRKRFTIAHELAHYILHRKEDDEIFAHRDAGASGPMESEANLFAANVLMPRELVIDALENLQLEVRYSTESMKVNHIAREFVVSPDAARVRLRQLEII